jgi:WD40 repeat protein
LLILKGDDDILTVIDAATGQTVRTLPIGFPYAITPDGRIIAAYGGSGRTIIWDAESGEQISVIPVRADYPSIPVLHSNFLAVSTALEAALPGEEYEVQLWDIDTGTLIRTFPDDPRIGSLAFSPDGAFLATGTVNGFVKLWDLATSP